MLLVRGPDGHRSGGAVAVGGGAVEALGALLQSQSRDQRITRGKTNGQEKGKRHEGRERERSRKSENKRREEGGIDQ